MTALAWVLAGALATLAVAGLLSSAAVLLIKGEVHGRLAAFEEATGRPVRLGGIGLGLLGALSLTDIRVGAGDGTELVTIRELGTDLDFLAILAGRRRPERLSIEGLRMAVGVDRDGLVGVDDLMRRLRGSGDRARSSGSGGLRELALSDVAIEIDAAALDVSPSVFVVRDLEGTVRRRDDGALVVEAAGRATSSAWETPLTLHLTTGAQGHVRIAMDEAVDVRVPLGGQLWWIAAAAGERDAAGGTRLEDVRVEVAGASFTGRRLEMLDDRPGLAPRPARARALSIEELAFEHRRGHGTAKRLGVSLAPGEPWPTPTRVELEAVAGSWPAGGLDATAARCVVTLEPGPLARPTELSPAAVRTVRVEGPQVDLRLAESTLAGGLPGRDLALRWLEGEELVVPATVATTEATQAPQDRPPWAVPTEAVDLLAQLDVTIGQGHLRVIGPRTDDESLILDNLTFLTRAGAGGGVDVGVSALIRRSGGRKTGSMDLDIGIEASGELRASHARLSGTDFAHLLSRFSEYVTVEPEAWVALDVDYEPPREDEGEGWHRLRGRADLADFGFQSWRISHTPLTGLEGHVSFDLKVDPGRHRGIVSLPSIRIGDLSLDGHLDITAVPGERPVIDVGVTMPLQDCGAAARSIPRALLPRLEGLQLDGAMWFEASLVVDLANPKGLKLRVDGDTEACRVVRLGGGIDIRELLSPYFVHHPTEPELGLREDISVGPGTAHWVRSAHIPRFVKAAAIVTEDRGFYDHKGVRWDLVARGLKLNLERGRFVYGGSTITQQLVKNVYLTREKTLSRKLEELIIAWEMERTLSKDQILTLYVNLIEYGRNIYGLRQAAHFYFGTEPASLSPAEASFIMGLKPYPKAGYHQWQTGRLNEWWVRRVAHVMRMLYEREGAITKAELLAAAPFQVDFRAPGEPLWGDRAYVRPPSTGEEATTEEPFP